jgi:hypothetical protein
VGPITCIEPMPLTCAGALWCAVKAYCAMCLDAEQKKASERGGSIVSDADAAAIQVSDGLARGQSHCSFRSRGLHCSAVRCSLFLDSRFIAPKKIVASQAKLALPDCACHVWTVSLPPAFRLCWRCGRS